MHLLPSTLLALLPLQVTYFQMLHVLAIFVMLGLGADDVFVFVDAFRQVTYSIPITLQDSKFWFLFFVRLHRASWRLMRCSAWLRGDPPGSVAFVPK